MITVFVIFFSDRRRLRPLKDTEATLSAVILSFSTLSDTKSQILTPERYDEHPRHFL